MRNIIRPFLLGVLLAAAFFFITTHHRSNGWDSSGWISRPTHLELTNAAGPVTYDPEEQINIAVYKKALPSVVNVTSTTVAIDFFYGAVPQEGQGWVRAVARQTRSRGRAMACVPGDNGGKLPFS